MTQLPILEVQGVTKRFAFGAEQITALSDASLRIGKGEFICLIGPSGCGKSTLLRMVAGFETATAGSLLMWGKPIAGPGPDRGMVFQDYGLFPWLTVAQNVGFGPAARGRPKAEVAATAKRFVDMVGLTRFADAYPHQLSGGMQQRVAIARVLANDAEVVLMDEPFGALDAMTRERLQEELLEVWARAKLTVLFVTHAIEEAIFLSDRIVVMSPGPGRIVADEQVMLPRPRDPTSPEFNALRRRFAAMLGGHH
ncbi:ABC transporter ATP-binding protein [Siccirubricoccus sp. KC 17139]|uniref:ABC transporter ATP-binding protein n=1 Tax=Siccirubricoccus soli TaxID=2899147 RepID=A0ABT1D709_9PROT|nr:ABC transporter ATP-binding protein [Siccirubricoccus soli]MCO6417716.1 ABC transporter ATP-binding protein [Siccirubricoccus soli]MCP2683851.1 ABC transporter ATP-binding protein [Siccirubricoccus soli]